MRHLILTFLILLAGTVIADGSEHFRISFEHGCIEREYPEGSLPVIGLALSGGGARGFAHIGILDVLEENGIRIGAIAGTSMGSIIGGLYAAGYSPAALRDIVYNIDWTEIFTSSPRRKNIYIGEKETSQWPMFELRFDGWRAQIPSSLSSGQRVASLLSWLTLEPTYACGRDFNRLPIPFLTTATDLKTGNKVVIDSGNLGLAIQASSTIPLLFSPVEWDNWLLVDGGLVDNLPVEDVAYMGSDFVIGVAIEESMHEAGELSNPLNVADQVTSIMMRGITQLSRDSADFIIDPDVNAFSSRSFTDIDSLIASGRMAALEAIPALKDSIAARMVHYPRQLLNDVIVLPDEAETEVKQFFSSDIGSEVLNATIIEHLEALWATGRWCVIDAGLDTTTGILAVTLTETPREVVIRIAGADNDSLKAINSYAVSGDDIHTIQDIQYTVTSYLHDIRSEGYSFAHVTSTAVSGDRMSILVDVPRLTRIFHDPSLTSRKAMIIREFQIDVGDVFDLRKVEGTVESLYGTGLYEFVYADIEQYEGGVGLRLHIEEKGWTVTRFGLRYDQTTGAEGRMNLTQENILGFGNQLILTGHIGNRRQLALIENKNDRILSSLYTFSIKAYYHKLHRPVYNGTDLLYHFEDNRFGTVFSIGQQMEKLGNAVIQFKTETVRTYYPIPAGRENGNKEFRSIIVRSLIDSYDRYPFPRNGVLNMIYIESASEVFGGSEQFAKIFLGNSMTRTFFRRHTFSYGLLVGTADPSIPDIEAFRLGGLPTRLSTYDPASADSQIYADFMGLADEERSGTRLAVGKLSYRLYVPRAFHLELMYHIGNVWARGQSISTDSLIQGYGALASFATFLGPISFGWGITSEGNDRAYLSAGWEF